MATETTPAGDTSFLGGDAAPGTGGTDGKVAAGTQPPTPGAASTTGGTPPATPPAGEKGADGKDGKGTEGEKAPPAELELKLPDGFKPDEAVLGKFKAAAKELGLKSDGAQKLVDFWAEQQTAANAAAATQLETLHKGWADGLKADKEIGGAQYDVNRQVARKAIEKFATPELRGFLQETGLGNHPEFARLFVRLGKAMAEDSVARSGTEAPGATPLTSDDAFARALFPNTPSMFKE